MLLLWLLARTLVEKVKERVMSYLEVTNEHRKEKLFKLHITMT